MINVLKKSSYVLTCMAVALALSLASTAGAAEGKGKVEGKVLDKDGKAAPGVNVVLVTPRDKDKDKKDKKPAPAAAGDKDKGDKKGDREKPIAKTTTESDGTFKLADVPAGDFVVMARTKDKMVAHEKVTVKAGETVKVELKLGEMKHEGKGKEKGAK